MNRAYKYRLYPDEAQMSLFARTFGCARLLYNECLSWFKAEYKAASEEVRPMGHLPLVTYFKGEHPFMKEVDSLALMNARKNFERALDNFFDSRSGKRKGRKMGFPGFKKKGKCRDSYTTNNQNGTVAVSEDAVRLPKAGWVRASVHRTIPEDGRVLSATVSRDRDGRYYVSVLVETPRPDSGQEVRPLVAEGRGA